MTFRNIPSVESFSFFTRTRRGSGSLRVMIAGSGSLPSMRIVGALHRNRRGKPVLPPCVGLSPIRLWPWRLDRQEFEIYFLKAISASALLTGLTYSSEVLFIECRAIHGDLDIVPNLRFSLKAGQGWWQGPLQVLLGVSRSLNRTNEGIDGHAIVVERELRR